MTNPNTKNDALTPATSTEKQAEDRKPYYVSDSARFVRNWANQRGIRR